MHFSTLIATAVSAAALASASPLAPRAVTCPAVDNDGSPLLSQGLNGNFVVCAYQAARRCEYFSNGSFSSGSSVCPSSIGPSATGHWVRAAALDPLPEAAAEAEAAPEPAPETGDHHHHQEEKRASCPPTDNNGSPLLSTGIVADPPNGIRCVYRAARTCTYFSNGSFSSGSSVCPSSI
jgi:hypothetical protein